MRSFPVFVECLSSLETPDALDRRALFDATTRLKEQEIEIADLRQFIPNRAEHDQLKRDYQELQQCLYEEQQMVQSLREQIPDAEVLAEKEQMIKTLEIEKQNEVAQIRRTKDAEISELRTEVEELNGEVRTKQAR